MGPIPGISWADVLDVAAAFALTIGMLWVQYSFGGTNPTGSGRVFDEAVAVLSIVPLLFIAANRVWLPAAEALIAGSLLLWIGAVFLVLWRAARFRERLAALRAREAELAAATTEAVDTAEAMPAAQALVAAATEPVEAAPTDRPLLDSPRTTPLRRPFGRVPLAWVALIILAVAIVAPRAVVAVTTQTPCEQAEGILAGDRDGDREASPDAWMPEGGVPGFTLVVSRPTTLGGVANSRKNPEESLRELIRDGFVSGYEQRWDGFVDHVGFEAQHFATSAGAIAFQAFAIRYACQFANEAFAGPRGGVGLQIRFATGAPIGEQISWVSNTTRVIVFASFAGPPPDHSRIIALMQLVSP